MAEVLAPDDLQEVEPSDGGSAPLTGGTRLGRYELLLPIAKGGMARVWAARQHGHRGFTKLVAIKTILPHLASDPEFEKMFLDEAHIAAGVHHPNVCEIYELGEEGKTLFMAMEWVPGDSFSRVLKASGKLVAIDPRVAARIVADACAGLHAAHNLTNVEGQPLNVVHRDVSPHNILVSADGVVKVADFGVAKALNQLHHATSAGQLKGKIAYMAPEQVTGGHIDRRSDLFSLGCVLYEATTGVQPFKGDGDHQVMHKLLKGEYAKPSEIVRGYPAELEAIIVRALSSQPLQRFPNAERMKVALEEWIAKSGPIVGSGQVAQVVRSRIGAVLDKRKERIRVAMAVPAAERPLQVMPSEPPPAGLTPSQQGRSGVHLTGIGQAPPQSIRSAPPLPPAASREMMHTLRLDENAPPPSFSPRPFDAMHAPLPDGLLPTGAGPQPSHPMAPTVTTALELPIVPGPGSGPSSHPVSSPPISGPQSGPQSVQPPSASLQSTPPPNPMQYALAAAIGIGVAGIIGVGAFFVVRAARAPKETPVAVATATAPTAAAAPEASAHAQSAAATAPAAAPAEGAVLFKVFPESAVLVVAGSPLDKDTRSIARPKAGEKIEVVVRADGYKDQSFTIDRDTTSPLDVWLVDNAATAPAATPAAPAAGAGGSGGSGGAKKSDPIPANPY